MRCPHCHSEHVELRRWGKRVGAGIGGLAGAASGWSTFCAGAEAGAVAGTCLGGPLGTIAGAVLGGLSGAAAGLVVGSKLGEAVDEHLIGRYYCPNCRVHFAY